MPVTTPESEADRIVAHIVATAVADRWLSLIALLVCCRTDQVRRLVFAKLAARQDIDFEPADLSWIHGA